MINWNTTDARKVEKLSDLAGDDEQTVVRPRPAPPKIQTNGDNEKSVRAIALLVAIGLTATLSIWRDPKSLLWWFLAGLAVSAWCCALGSFIGDILRAVVAWLVEACEYLRGLVASWRDAAKRFANRWIWSRFRATEETGGNHVTQ